MYNLIKFDNKLFKILNIYNDNFNVFFNLCFWLLKLLYVYELCFFYLGCRRGYVGYDCNMFCCYLNYGIDC